MPSDSSTNLQLPYLMASQSQKHVTHNEALRMLDAIVQLSVSDRDLVVPPTTPAEGERFIVGDGAADAWSGHDGNIAAWQDGTWAFLTPREGWLAWVADEASLLVWQASGWVDVTTAALANLALLGINASADAINRLAVSADATLFSHDGGGHQLKINKATAGETASLLFQTGFAGRAEIGTAGDDNIRFKVSPDGVSWSTALRIDAATGQPVLPSGTASEPAMGFDGAEASGLFHVGGGQIGMSINGLERVRFDGNGRVGIGGAPSDALNIYDGGIQVQADTARGLRMEVYSDTIGVNAYQRQFRARGTRLSPQAAQKNDYLGELAVFGHGATTFGSMVGRLVFRANENYTDSAKGSFLQLFLTADGQSAVSEAMRVLGNGNVGIGGGFVPSTRLHVDGAVRVGSFTVSTLPSASANGAGSIVFVSDATGGPALVFSDGSDWRRADDGSVVF